MNEVNSILFKSEDQMHMFLLVDGVLSHPNSIPITDEQGIYKDFSESQICLSETIVTRDSEKIENKDYDESKMESYSYDIRDISSFTMSKGEGKEELKIIEIISEGKLADIIADLIKEVEVSE